MRCSMRGAVVFMCRTTTASNGEDGVDVDTGLGQIKHVFVNGVEAAKSGPFFATWSAGVVTILALAGSAGDAALVSMMAMGYN